MRETGNSIGAIYAFDVLPEGTAIAQDADNLGKLSSGAAYRWVHLDLEHPGAFDWIKLQADEMIAEALTLDDTRPRHAYEKGASLLILRGVNLNPAADPEDMVSIRLWVSKQLIITVRRHKVMAVASMCKRIEDGQAPSDVGDFLAFLADSMTERMVPVIDGLVDELDALEETSLSGAVGLRRQLAELRRSVIALRRYIGPQRDAISRLSIDAPDLIKESQKTALRETVDRITRTLEEMDAIRERCGVMNDQLADARAEEMNRNMMILSVIAAIFLPLGFLTGLLGVNVGGIPGTNSPYAFTILCLLMTGIGVGITLYFKRLNWL